MIKAGGGVSHCTSLTRTRLLGQQVTAATQSETERDKLAPRARLGTSPRWCGHHRCMRHQRRCWSWRSGAKENSKAQRSARQETSRVAGRETASAECRQEIVSLRAERIEHLARLAVWNNPLYKTSKPVSNLILAVSFLVVGLIKRVGVRVRVTPRLQKRGTWRDSKFSYTLPSLSSDHIGQS